MKTVDTLEYVIKLITEQITIKEKHMEKYEIKCNEYDYEIFFKLNTAINVLTDLSYYYQNKESFLEEISQSLQEANFEDASKYIDCKHEI